MKSLRLAVLASGGGSNLQSIIDAIENGTLKSQITCVISNKVDAYALARARAHNIEAIYINPKSGTPEASSGMTYDEKLLAVLKEKNVDLVVLAGYLKIVAPEMIDAYPGKIINIHPSLLPKYGGQGYYGLHVHKAVVEAGDKESGATVHFVDKGIDTGEIILQRSIPVQEGDSPQTLQTRVLEEVEHKIFVEALAMLEKNKTRGEEVKILLIGNGGREHALAQTILRFHPDANIFVAPGNAGTATIATNIDYKVTDIQELATWASENNIDLTIPGPEAPLVIGVVDAFNKKGLRVFGPNEECAQFEGSKRFTKEFLVKYKIPTAKYAHFITAEPAIDTVDEFDLPIVVKADGLAAGKGVLICESREDAKKEIKEIFAGKFGSAGDEIVLEEFLTGTEASLLCWVDGKTIVPLETARDYKRALDNDEGLNTGGMGGFSPNPAITLKVRENIQSQVLDPIISGFKSESLDFKGILFIGLMIENDIPKVLEFNVRFGDPETQSVLPRLRTDIVEIMNACIDGTLEELDIKWDKNPSATIVLASKGYPETSSKGDIITGLDHVSKNVTIFHGGTKNLDGNIATDGGRVLALTAVDETMDKARASLYRELEKIKFDGMQFRTDIAKNI
ncbi:MAG TPA: phosphoribosylamine--glycine ligase [Epulopiscium sp.]|nr:phosphoribosylamine--glycine ligase [Candidatus Epulonipiscium sp.]